jgi:glycosyltransferase involved in cell wall biosynthesis
LRVREAGGPRISNEEYWRTLARADVILSTSTMSHGPSPVDQVDETHLIYRFMEACAVGRPLVTQAVPGADDVFRPDLHFLECTDAASAAEVILKALSNAELRERIAEGGLQRAAQLVETKYFWRAIDESLGGALSAN